MFINDQYFQMLQIIWGSSIIETPSGSLIFQK